MSYRPSYFGSTELPGSAYRVTDGSRSRTSATRTVGGFVDADGTTAQLELPYTLGYSALVYESTGIAALGVTLDALRAMQGKRDKLMMVPWSWQPMRLSPRLSSLTKPPGILLASILT